MFDFLSALRPFNGYRYSFNELRKLMVKLRTDNIADISPEFGIKEMLTIAVTRGWVTEDDNGVMIITV